MKEDILYCTSDLLNVSIHQPSFNELSKDKCGFTIVTLTEGSNIEHTTR